MIHLKGPTTIQTVHFIKGMYNLFYLRHTGVNRGQRHKMHSFKSSAID